MPFNSPDSHSASRHETELSACVHCGFCLNHCPTYLESGSEADSPRGRIVLMQALQSGDLPADEPSLRSHLDSCLGCRACEPACPSGVHYGSLIEYARAEVNATRPIVQRTARRALLNMLSSPARTAAATNLARYSGERLSRFGLKLLQSDGSSAAAAALPAVRQQSSAPLPEFVPAVGERRARVGLLTGCVMRVMYGDVNFDTARILAANGCEVVIPAGQGCCGALHLHNGELAQGRVLAERLIDAFSSAGELDAIVINSAGCGSTMKEYGSLLGFDAELSSVTQAFASRCRDITEFLDDLGWVAPLRAVPATAAYHDACHLAQAQRITAAPRRLLALIPGLNVVPLAESEVLLRQRGHLQPDPARDGAAAAGAKARSPWRRLGHRCSSPEIQAACPGSSLDYRSAATRI